MNVALIGHVHANLLALEAVLADASDRGVGAIWSVGHLAGLGASPEEVIQRLRRAKALSILGNNDRQILRIHKKKDKWKRGAKLETYHALKWAYDSLSKDSRSYLRFLSRRVRMTVKGHRILLTYTTPGSSKTILDPETSDRALRTLAQDLEADVIISGYSHQPFVRQIERVWFINPGSVGFPGDGDTRASYAVLQIERDQIQVQHHRVAYDVEQAVSAIRENKLPEILVQMLLQARDMEEILQENEDQMESD